MDILVLLSFLRNIYHTSYNAGLFIQELQCWPVHTGLFELLSWKIHLCMHPSHWSCTALVITFETATIPTNQRDLQQYCFLYRCWLSVSQPNQVWASAWRHDLRWCLDCSPATPAGAGGCPRYAPKATTMNNTTCTSPLLCRKHPISPLLSFPLSVKLIDLKSIFFFTVKFFKDFKFNATFLKGTFDCVDTLFLSLVFTLCFNHSYYVNF